MFAPPRWRPEVRAHAHRRDVEVQADDARVLDVLKKFAAAGYRAFLHVSPTPATRVIMPRRYVEHHVSTSSARWSSRRDRAQPNRLAGAVDLQQHVDRSWRWTTTAWISSARRQRVHGVMRRVSFSTTFLTLFAAGGRSYATDGIWLRRVGVRLQRAALLCAAAAHQRIARGSRPLDIRCGVARARHR